MEHLIEIPVLDRILDQIQEELYETR
jgi:hypothetical protein